MPPAGHNRIYTTLTDTTVDKHGGVPPFAETRSYVRTILASLSGSSAPPVSLARREADNLFRSVRLLAFAGGSDVPEN